MRTLIISERAEADLRAIWRYSFESWGETQADRYLDALDDEMRKSATEPERGKLRDPVRAGYWSRLVRQHIVFYTFTDTEVLIQRVLHGSMDPIRHA